MPRVLIVIAACLALGACAEADPEASPSLSPVETLATEATSAPGATEETAEPARDPKTFTLDAEDDGKRLALIPGDKVVLSLETNPSTGYSWEYMDAPDEAVLEEVSDETVKPETSPGLVGAPEERTWTYLAKSVGSTTVKLGYTPPSDGPAEDTFAFSVSVS